MYFISTKYVTTYMPFSFEVRKIEKKIYKSARPKPRIRFQERVMAYLRSAKLACTN
jgi:hypothetical protein